MARDESAEPGPGFFGAYGTYLIVGGVLVLVVLLGLSLIGPTGGGGPDPKKSEDDPRAVARAALTRETDLGTCRNALQQFNAYLSQDQAHRTIALGADRREQLQSLLGLDPGELGELESPSFTLLDGHYLEECFLFRDAARSLDVLGASDADGQPLTPAPLERVTAAFAWAMREVRPAPAGPVATPPLFVARRGWGSDLERALVFLAVLRQVGRPEEHLTGCLVFLPQPGSLTPKFWACGVSIGDGTDLYLFDPRMGLPLPGPGGKGVATLAQVRGKPEVLAQLNADEKHQYDVTAAQVERVELHLVCPLSGLTARMENLQKNLLGPNLHVNVAVPALEEHERLKAAGDRVSVEAWKVAEPDGRARDGCGLLRRFLPPTEGGVDASSERLRDFGGRMIPLQLIPTRLRDRNLFPGKSPPAQEQLVKIFSQPFLSCLEPRKARDLLLRGRFDEAASEKLSKDDIALTEQENRGGVTPEVLQGVEEWAKKAESAYAELVRLTAQKADPQAIQQAEQAVGAVWATHQLQRPTNPMKDAPEDAAFEDMRRTPGPALPLVILLQDASVKVRHAEVTYQLALCTQERAEQIQAKIDLIAAKLGRQAVKAEDWEEARKQWNEALVYWPRCTEGPGVGAARRLRGRAELLLANALTALADLRPADPQAPQWREQAARRRADALAAWRDLTGLTPLEQVAVLYLARQASGGE
jgi:hypothetical protein